MDDLGASQFKTPPGNHLPSHQTERPRCGGCVEEVEEKGDVRSLRELLGSANPQ